MITKTKPYDVANYLRNLDEMAAYLEAAIEECHGDAGFVARALGDIARAQGMTGIAKETGLGRESLYKSLSRDGNPKLETFLKVTNALGLKLQVVGDSSATGDVAIPEA